MASFDFSHIYPSQASGDNDRHFVLNDRSIRQYERVTQQPNYSTPQEVGDLFVIVDLDVLT